MWSDNEDDVLLSNNSHDMMDLGTLSDDIISAGFPDDDEELFGEN